MGFSVKDIPDQKDKVFVVTGGTSGIGLVTAQVLYAKNATVILTARSAARGDEALAIIRKEVPESKGSIQVGIMEQKDLKSVRTFADWFLALNLPLHGLILNAGVMGAPILFVGRG